MGTVNAVTEEYQRMLNIWTRCRDVHAGGDAVKSKKTLYLPMLEGHAMAVEEPGYKQIGIMATGYSGYLMRAAFYPAGRRTVQGLQGLIFGHPVSVAGVPKTYQQDLEDVTLTGVTLQEFALSVCEELLIVGRVGALLDMPLDPVPGARPYWIQYETENILNVRTERIEGTERLVFMVLEEQVEIQNPEDEYVTTLIKQWRVLRLEKTESGMVYTVEVFRQAKDNQKEFVVHLEKTTPQKTGRPLDYIPFTFFSAAGITPDMVLPPLLDLFDVNLSHYRTSADHEHGAHFTALPTPYVTGHKLGAGQQLGIGSGTAWVFENPAATAGMVEFSGAGLQSLANLKEEKRSQMATLGARMLESQKLVGEAAETVRLRHAGESSTLGILAAALSQGLTQMLRHHLEWVGAIQQDNTEPVVTVNPDVLDTLSSEDVKVLVTTWQAGAISKRTLYENLEWGEWTRPGVTFEEEEIEISREDPGSVPPDPNLPPEFAQ